MLLSALSFSLMTVCVKGLQGRIPLAEVVLARAVVSVVLTWWMLRRARVDPWGRRRGLLLLRGLIGSAGLFCVYAAVMRLPLAAATVLQYLHPTFSALLAWLLLGERLGRRLLLAIAVGWLGVLVMARPTALPVSLPPALSLGDPLAGGSPLALDGVAIAVIGALLSALAYVTVRALARSEHPLVIVLYFPLVAIPLSLPPTLLDPVLPTPGELLWLAGVGLFTQIGQIALTHGLARLPAARATALSYIQVAFAALWGWWLFGETLDGWTSLGAGLIFAATLLSLRPSGRAPGSPTPSAGRADR